MNATVVLAELRHATRRFTAVTLAIGISVMFVGVCLSATDTARGWLQDAAAGPAAGADAVVLPGAGTDAGRFAAAGPRLRAVPGVAAVTAVRTVLARSPGQDVWQVQSLPAAALATPALTSGRLPRRLGEVAVDQRVAAVARVTTGATLGLEPLSPQGPAARPTRVTVVGTLRTTLAQQFAGSGAGTVLATDPDLVRWGAATPDAWVLDVRPGADAASVAATAGRGAGTPVTARTGEAEGRELARHATHGVDVLGVLVLGFAVISLVVAGIVVANTYQILLAQRVRQVALLRCIGATRRQVFRGVTTEALLVGAAGSVLGLLACLAVTVGTVAVLDVTVTGLAMRPVVSAAGVAVPLLTGVLLTVASAVGPARAATRVHPLAVLRAVDAAPRGAGRLRVAAALLLLTGGTAVMVVAARAGILLVAMAGGVLSLLGVLLLGPVLVPLLGRALGPALRAVAGVPGDLAAGNAVRNPRRASATATALLLGVSLVTLLTVGARTSSTSAQAELARQVPVDAAVEATDGDLPARVVAALPAVRGVAATAPVAGARVGGLPGGRLELTGVGAAAGRVLITGGVPADGTVLLPRSWLRDGGPAEGGTLRLSGRDGSLTLRVVAGPEIGALVSLSSLRALDRAAAGGTRAVWVRAGDGVDPASLVADLQRAAPRASVTSGLLDRRSLQQGITALLWVAVGLLAVSVLIALVGIANTLALSVLERTREIGVQRALGMTRSQLRAALTLEAVVLALVGAGTGVGLGILYGWAGSTTLMAMIHAPVHLSVPWDVVTAVVAGACLAAVVAGVLPSRRAARVSPTEALATT